MKIKGYKSYGTPIYYNNSIVNIKFVKPSFKEKIYCRFHKIKLYILYNVTKKLLKL